MVKQFVAICGRNPLQMAKRTTIQTTQNKQHLPQQPNQPQQPHSLSTYGHIDYKAETSMATQRIFLLRLIGKNYEEGQPNFN